MGKLGLLILILILVCARPVHAQSNHVGPYPSWLLPIQHCQEGLLIGNGELGIMLWGKPDTLKLTIALAGNWDRRGGAKNLVGITYQGITQALGQPNSQTQIDSLFKPLNTPLPGQPARPFQLGIADVFIPVAKGAKWISMDLNGLGQAVLTFKTKTGQTKTAVVECAASGGLLTLSSVAPFLNFKAIAATSAVEFSYNELSKYAYQPPLKTSNSVQYTIPGQAKVVLNWQAVDQNLFFSAKRTSLAQAPTIPKNSSATYAQLVGQMPVLTCQDAALVQQYNYAKHLLLAASLSPDSPPVALQGPFNESYQLPPWSNDYHFNINAQLCYAPFYASGLAAQTKPLWEMVRRWQPRLNQLGKAFFNRADAYLLPHAVDDSLNIMGGFWTGTIDHGCTAWLATMAYRHYTYTYDTAFLRQTAYPLLKGTLAGYMAMGRYDSTTKSLSLPVSVSPEFRDKRMDAQGRNASFQLAACRRALLDFKNAARILQTSDSSRYDSLFLLPRFSTIFKPRYADYEGQRNTRIGLWEGQDLVESHRHHSHLAGIYPFATLGQEPGDSLLIVNTLDHLTLIGPGLWTGWGVPWAATLYTRAALPDAAYAWLKWWQNSFLNNGHNSVHDADFVGISLANRANRNRGNATGPKQIMELDGNFSFIDAVAELFGGQHADYYQLNCTVPRQLGKGSFQNVHLPSGYTASIWFNRGRVSSIQLNASHAFGPLTLRVPGQNLSGYQMLRAKKRLAPYIFTYK